MRLVVDAKTPGDKLRNSLVSLSKEIEEEILPRLLS